MSWDPQEAKDLVDEFISFVPASAPPADLLKTVEPGKVFEFWVLCEVLERLHNVEGYTVEIRNGTSGAPLSLRTSPGPISPAYAHVHLDRQDGSRPLTMWTDIEFTTLSLTMGAWPAGDNGWCHELDVVAVDEGVTGRPNPSQVRLGVECKATAFRKDQLRAILGVRRELSLLDFGATCFRKWPASKVPADPASCLLFRSRDPKASNYAEAGRRFGIDISHVTLPGSP